VSLGSSVGGLLSGIETAYNNAIENGSQEDNADNTLLTLGSDMGSAIDTYYVSADVFTDVTIDSGQKDVVGGSTSNEGRGSGTGFLESLETDILKNDLYKAFKAATDTGATSDPIPQLAQDVGDAVHKYMISPTVVTTVVAFGGQTTNASAGTANPVGTVASPGAGTAEGEVSFETGDVSTLKDGVETAYNTAKLNGKTGLSLSTLATDIHIAIHLFALTAIVSTDVTIFPGQVVAGYMAIAGPATVPLPATTLMGNGSGEGELS
jgi:hypothetical protein